MLNVGGGEFLVIALLALVVLGPQRLPEAARQLGKAMGELRRISSGFQAELKSAMDDPLEAAARERGAAHTPKARPADAPAVAPVASAPADGEAAATTPTGPAKAAPAKRAAATKPALAKRAAKKRSAPLRAASKPSNGSVP